MDWKRIGKKLLFPPVWLMVLLTVVSTVLLAMVFGKGWDQTIPAYAVYILAFYTLSVVTAFCVMVLPGQFRKIKQSALNKPFINRYMRDLDFRARSTMYLSLYINLLYVAMNLLFCYRNKTWWFVVLAGYYLILAFLWALLAGYIRSNPVGSNLTREWKRAKTCAFILLSINLSLTGAVLMILFRNKDYQYPGILIYVMALFTFYSIISAIIDMVKYRALGSPVLSTAKIVSLSAALVSLLNLETAMFAQFGGELPVEDRRIFIVLTGGGVSIIVVTLSVILIVNASKAIRREKYGK